MWTSNKRLSVVFLLAVFVMLLAPNAVFADDVVVYDAADFPCLSGRTKQDVMQKYTQATAMGATYIDGQRSTYYDVPASTAAPYAAGVLRPDTLLAMKGMSNFYRWRERH